MKPREVPYRNFPKYWLAMSDAAAFTLVQTVLGFAIELRRDIAEHLHVAPNIHAAEIAVLLLSAAEGGWGKGKGVSMVKEIVDPASLDEMRLAKLYLMVHRTLSRLPTTAWPSDRLGARRELLDELREKGRGLQSAMPSHRLKAEEKEQQWLQTARELPKPTTGRR
jgi:hypothetical protein